MFPIMWRSLLLWSFLISAQARQLDKPVDPHLFWVSGNGNPKLGCQKPNTTYWNSRSDGFGQQYAGQMYALSLARHCNGCYEFRGFRPFEFDVHSDSVGLHDQFDGNTFVGLKSDAKCGKKIKVNETTSDGSSLDENKLFTQEVRDELRASYWSSEKMGRDRDCEVAFHDRRADAVAASLTSGPGGARSSGNELLRITIERHFADKRVCIISQGQPAEFGPLQEMQNVKLKLDDSTPDAFHNMVAAPELVIGHSSMSWAAGILSTGPVYYFPVGHVNQGNFRGRELSTWHPLEVPSFLLETLETLEI